MGVFGGLIMTNRGRNLQVKAQTGVKLTFTRMAIGDGSLGSSSILELNALKNERKSLNLTKLKPSTGGMALIGAVLSNQDITAGFYFREVGIFANDPDVGEILYCYGNAGSTADYIPAGGGSDLIEKTININVIVGNAANVSATIDQSLVFETPQGAQEKANTAETNAKIYTDNQIASIDLSPLATKEELAIESQARVAHQADNVKHITAEERTAWNAKETTDGARKKIEQTSFSTVKSNKDAEGIYTTVEQRRKTDGTLAVKAVLSGGTSPQYTTRTITYYALDGITVEKTETFAISYDTDGAYVSEV
ncbi:hypothetical protein HMPREF1013_00825 [Bacillus sp. 2_A_57_CT2]|nr:hypothetical protein HMPREF1013_00825 [Bacillus sp. 2_A_57_CT2]